MKTHWPRSGVRKTGKDRVDAMYAPYQPVPYRPIF